MYMVEAELAPSPSHLHLQSHLRCPHAPQACRHTDEGGPCPNLAVTFSPFLAAPRPPWWKMLYLWFCGLSPGPTRTLSQEEKAALERRLTSIEEKPLWRTVCNVNAVLLLTINVFLWGYFG